MNRLNRRLKYNRLIQRVRRHSGFTTLFHEAARDLDETPQVGEQRSVRRALALPRGSIEVFSPAADVLPHPAASWLPDEADVTTPPTEITAPAPGPSAVMQKAAAGAPAKARATSPVLQPAPLIQQEFRSARVEALRPSAVQPPGVGETSPRNFQPDEWARLHAIMERHEARQAEQNNQNPSADSQLKPGETGSERAGDAGPAIQWVQADAAPVKTAAQPRTGEPEPQAKESKGFLSQLLHKLPMAGLKKTEPAVVEEIVKKAVIPEPAQLPVEIKQEPSSPDFLQPSDLSEKQPRREPSEKPAAADHPAFATVSREPGLMPKLGKPEEASELSARFSETIPSLESVWPVERTAGLERQIEHSLQSLPRKPVTDSVVELITPRTPRPVIEKGTSARAEVKAANENAAPELLRDIKENETETGPEFAETVMQAGQPIQPVQKTDKSENPAPRLSLVPTEIGPLPEDLWSLIGEQVPSENTPARQDSLSTQGHPAPEAAVVQRMQSNLASPQLPSAAAPDISPAAQGAPATPVPQQGTTGQTPPVANVDVDELSRQVYQQIRTKLQVEWERLHRRM